MLRLVLFVFLLITPVICCAEIYKWVNEKGIVGYADDLGKIPEKYRERAVATDKIEQAVEIVEKVEPDKSPRKNDAAGQEQKPTTDAQGTPKAKQLFDGKDGATWKRDFARQKHEVSSLEEQAEGIKSRMADPEKLSRGEYLALQNTLRDLDVRVSVARKKLEALEEAANSAELPADFR
jgi:hypothetical protein